MPLALRIDRMRTVRGERPRLVRPALPSEFLSVYLDWTKQPQTAPFKTPKAERVSHRPTRSDY
jgi:hypothetical protein